MALRVFQQARGALEATRGTSLTPTRILYAEEFEHEQEIATIQPSEYRNSYFPVFAASAGTEVNRFRMRGRMSFQDLVWHANHFFVALASGTGAGADKTWAFPPSGTADNVKTSTIQLGYTDTIGTAPGVELNYVMGETFNLHWEKNDDGAVTFESTFLAAKTATQITAFTGSLSDRTVTPMSANGTSVWIDATTIGTTADANVTAVDFTVNLAPVPFYALDGTVAAQAVYRPNWRTWSATVTRRFANDTEWDRYVDKAKRKLRIRTVGPVIPTTAVAQSATLDLYGHWTGHAWADIDGIITEELTLSQQYDTTATTDHRLDVVTDLATIT